MAKKLHNALVLEEPVSEDVLKDFGPISKRPQLSQTALDYYGA